jgi:endonuclease/exonuclease/phosphatase family metal-dependent hydrolase
MGVVISLGWSHARADITIATWNIAWLRNQPLSAADYQRCRSHTRETRAALDERDLSRWICRTADHYARLGAIAREINADIFAFQEVEGEQALARILPAHEYAFYVPDSPWIQRVGFAVRKGRIAVRHASGYAPLGAMMGKRSRSGADLDVLIDGRPVRILAVHLKSACHARPLTDETRHPRDDGSEAPACIQLGKQVKPLKDWIEARERERTPFLILGDFNRRFDTLPETTGPPRDQFGRQLGFWREIAERKGGDLVRLTAGQEQLRSCWGGDPKLPTNERAMFIDHIITDSALAKRVVPDSVRQWALREGKITREVRAELRELSDHCPLSVRIR